MILDAQTLAGICRGAMIEADGVAVGRVCIDSRRCMPGDVFFALCGRTDGHQYVEAARAAGAALVVVQRGRDVRGPRIEVDAPLDALQEYAGWVRTHRLGAVLAITGSNGKTIVKDALTALLMGSMRVACSPGSYNSQVGVPLALLSIPEGIDLAIIEVGVSAPGEMARQVRMVRPDYGILTNIGLAHIGSFGTKEVTAAEKLSLFEQLPANRWLLAPEDVGVVRTEAGVIHHGATDNVVLLKRTDTLEGVLLTMRFPNGVEKSIGVRTRSTHLVGNLMIAVSAAFHLGASPEHIASALEGYSCGPTRLEMWQSPQGVVFINDAYSADPLSVQAALEVEAQHATPGGKRVFVFAGMAELGHRSRKEHEMMGRLAADQGISHLVIPPRENTQWTAAAFKVAKPKGVVLEVPLEEWGDAVRALAEPGDTVLIKGPRSDGLVQEARRLWETMAGKRMVIDLGAIRENIACFRRCAPESRVLAMLKAWAYGTELGRMARWLQQCGLDWIGVSAADEGAMVRRAGVHLPILVTLLDAEEIDKVVRYGLTPAVYSKTLLTALERVAAKEQQVVEVHVKVDTGMGRLGIAPEDVLDVLTRLKQSKWIRVTGLMTHLSCADDASADAFTERQLDRFDVVVDAARAEGFTDLIVHASATSGAVRFPRSRYDMIRVGLGLYGIYPSPEVARGVELQLALALLGRIVHTATYQPGQRIGYGGTFVVDHPDTRIGIVQMGYNDGVPWRLSNVGTVQIRGNEVPIVGRVSMDSLALDLTDVPQVEIGDEVLILGAKDGEEIRPEKIADLAGTIPYELMVKIDSRRVQRVFVGD